MFSARLRLPSKISISEKRRRVEDLITLLGLEKCANTKVGDEKVRRKLNYLLKIIFFFFFLILRVINKFTQ